MVTLFACALLLRMLVPQGWMPTSDAAGLHITICSGSGPVEAPAEAKAMAERVKHGPAQKDHQDNDHPCIFAGLGLAVIEPILPALILPSSVAILSFLPALSVAIGQGLAAPPPPSTGPPSTL